MRYGKVVWATVRIVILFYIIYAVFNPELVETIPPTYHAIAQVIAGVILLVWITLIILDFPSDPPGGEEDNAAG